MQEKVLCWKWSPNGIEKLTFANEKTPDSFDEASILIPVGAYTTFRTYHKFSALHFPSHIQRLEETARLIQKEIRLDHQKFHLAVRNALSAAPWDECRVRITVLPESEGNTIFIFLEELLTPSPEQYQMGVNVVTIKARRENPKAKLSGFLPIARNYRGQSDTSAHELLMVSEDNEILEGLSSNFFAVRNGVLHTAGSGILEGITRSFVLEIARKLNFPLSFDAIQLEDVARLDESFITSSSRGILPVVKIDDIQIGQGKPGQLTMLLSSEFEEKLDGNLEEI